MNLTIPQISALKKAIEQSQQAIDHGQEAINKMKNVLFRIEEEQGKIVELGQLCTERPEERRFA